MSTTEYHFESFHDFLLLLLLFSFVCLPVMSASTLRLCASQSLVPGYPDSSNGVGLKLNQTFCGIFTPPLPQHILQAGHIIGGWFFGQVAFHISLLVAFRVPYHTRESRV